jgi:hypothetical protein
MALVMVIKVSLLGYMCACFPKLHSFQQMMAWLARLFLVIAGTSADPPGGYVVPVLHAAFPLCVCWCLGIC